MDIYSAVFNRAIFYETLFLNVKGVLEYPDLDILNKKRPDLFKRWNHIYVSRFLETINDEKKAYKQKAIYMPEFTKIVGFSMIKIKIESNELKKKVKKFASDNEFEVIQKIIEELSFFHNESLVSNRTLKLCGHNITGYDIPLLIKRLIFYRKELKAIYDVKLIPQVFKEYLTSKPWDSNVIDTINLWKFGGNEYSTLQMIKDFMDLKTTEGFEELQTHDDLSEYYWKNIAEHKEEVLNHISLQSLNQTNLAVQFINEFNNF